MFNSTALPLVLACLTLLPVSGAATSAWASPSRQASETTSLPVVEITHETIVLPNGLTLIVHEDHTTPVVSIGIWYHVGSANETQGRTGFAHLFEHLMFNGSENADTDWFAAMNEVGATGMNGTTGNDRTNYFQTVPTGAVDRVLWLESDRMGHLLGAVDEAKLEEQRRVVQNEKRQRANTPLGEAPEIISAATYPVGHPYSWTPIGSMADLDAASLEDVRTFFKRWYGPSNAVLVLSGDITVQQAREKVERYFGDIPGGPPLARSREQVAKMTGETRGELQASVANAMVLKIWNAPGWARVDAQLLELAASVLSDGPNSRLQKRLVRELELASEVDVSMQKLELGSQFVVQATVRPGVDVATLEAALDAEMADFLAHGPSVEELDRIKFDYYAASVRSAASTMSLAETLAEGQLYAGSSDYYREQLQTIYAAAPQDIRDAARRWLSDGVYILDVTPMPSFITASVTADRSSPPPVASPVAFALPPLQHATLSNGLRVALAERHDLPTVNLSMIFDVGALPDRNPASIGLSTAFGLTTAGTTSLNELQIAARRQALGAMMNWQTSDEYTRFGLNALKLKLADSLDLYVDILKHPTFPEAEWDRLRAIYSANYEDNKRSPQGKVGLVSPALNYGPDHPYAAQMTPEIAARLTTDDFRRHYNHWIRPDLATLFIVGDTTLEEIMPMLEARLADWRAPAGPAPVKPSLPPAASVNRTRVVLVDQPGAESSLILAGQAGPRRGDPSYEAMDLVNTVLGGSFTSRLNMNLREDKGWSYGASSEVDAGARLGRVTAGAAVQTDKTAEAMSEIDRELRELGTTRLPSPEEVQAARNDMLLGMPAQLQGVGGVLTMYRSAYEYDLPEGYWDSYVARVQALSQSQVEQAAATLYDSSKLTWIVVGDLSKIEAGVRGLGLGDVEVVDLEGRRLR
ncbi:pitrilysin family protein [Brevundimonas vesicularis]|uniref:M16 family metallopeptidase n=1 Tax=Brevundimonas vesicularis TaxID=41276 RepID=UPI0022EC1861|nr:pitrilysin family protein [Brevundimonas vesicularis]WBT06362.1 pitrilysin family protein [Brevundimonas vesicularis]